MLSLLLVRCFLLSFILEGRSSSSSTLSLLNQTISLTCKTRGAMVTDPRTLRLLSFALGSITSSHLLLLFSYAPLCIICFLSELGIFVVHNKLKPKGAEIATSTLWTGKSYFSGEDIQDLWVDYPCSFIFTFPLHGLRLVSLRLFSFPHSSLRTNTDLCPGFPSLFCLFPCDQGRPPTSTSTTESARENPIGSSPRRLTSARTRSRTVDLCFSLFSYSAFSSCFQENNILIRL